MASKNSFKTIIPAAFIIFCFHFTLDSSQLYEQYLYQAVPVGQYSEKNKEIIVIQLNSENNILREISTVNAGSNTQTVDIKLKPDGEFISGHRIIKNINGKITEKKTLLAGDGFAYLIDELKNSKRKYVIPKNKSLATADSLLVSLRTFTFDKPAQKNFFMIDFSGAKVSVNVRQTGEETVSVPAGKFECYLLEIEVNFFLFHPKIYLWLTKEPPHFPVKHLGKRGPFTKYYLTSLLKKEIKKETLKR